MRKIPSPRPCCTLPHPPGPGRSLGPFIVIFIINVFLLVPALTADQTIVRREETKAKEKKKLNPWKELLLCAQQIAVICFPFQYLGFFFCPFALLKRVLFPRQDLWPSSFLPRSQASSTSASAIERKWTWLEGKTGTERGKIKYSQF